MTTIKEHFDKYGYVVIHNTTKDTDRERVLKLVEKLSKTNPEAKNGGFFDLYHDESLASIRQSPVIYGHFAKLLGRADLWVVFDRLIYMKEEEKNISLPLHVDQNPHRHPEFHGVQGLLALRDNNESTGMLTLLPGSHMWFDKYKQWSNNEQGWVEYKGEDVNEIKKQMIPIRLDEGDLVIWDSRITHSRMLPTTNKVNLRALMMISYQLASSEEELINARKLAFNAGIGMYNHEAGLRKTGGSRVPSLRQNAEKLTELGKKLYGLIPWKITGKRILMVAEPYGYGPASIIAHITLALREDISYIDYAGKNHTLDLQKQIPYNHIIDTSNMNSKMLTKLVAKYDAVITVTDDEVYEIAVRLGICTVVYDPLCWYWDSPKYVRADMVIVPDFMNVDRILKLASLVRKNMVKVNGAVLLRRPSVEKVDCVHVNFGGVVNPKINANNISNFVNLINDTVGEIGMEYTMLGSKYLEELTKLHITQATPVESSNRLYKCKFAIMTPGLGNIMEAHQANTKTIWLPPTNPSQARQLQLMIENGYANYYINWDMIYGAKYDYLTHSIEDIEEYLKICFTNLRNNKNAFMNLLKKCIADARENNRQECLNLVDRFGENGIVQIRENILMKLSSMKSAVYQYAVVDARIGDNIDLEVCKFTPEDELKLAAHIPGLKFIEYKWQLANDVNDVNLLEEEKNRELTFDQIHLIYAKVRKNWLEEHHFPVHGICMVNICSDMLASRAMLIVGPSGSGKTTTLLRAIESGMKVLSGDKTVVQIVNGRPFAMHGTRTITICKSDINKWANIRKSIVSELGDRVIFELADDYYSDDPARISTIDIIKPNAKFAKMNNDTALHTLYPIFLDKQREDVIINDDIFDGSITASVKTRLVELLKEMLNKVEVYSGDVKDIREVRFHKISEGKKCILYGICGIGTGHQTRALPVINWLLKCGHDVTIFTYGEAMNFFRKYDSRIQVLEVYNPYYVGDINGLNFKESIRKADNLGLKWNMCAMDLINHKKFSLIISDYEMVSAQYSYAKNIPLVTYDQQSKYMLGGFPLELNGCSYIDEIERLRMFFPKASKRLAISFFNVPEGDIYEQVTILPSVIREEVQRFNKVKSEHTSILVYLSSQQIEKANMTDLFRVFSQVSNVLFYVFVPDKAYLDTSDKKVDNVTVYKHGTRMFDEIFEKCHGIISTAGHMLLSEAMFVGKPVYAIPLGLYEQMQNAKVISDNGFGIQSNTLDVKCLIKFIENLDLYARNIERDTKILIKQAGNDAVCKHIEAMF